MACLIGGFFVFVKNTAAGIIILCFACILLFFGLWIAIPDSLILKYSEWVATLMRWNISEIG